MDERLEGRDYSNGLSAVTISPLLDEQSYHLFIGTAVGELWIMDPTQALWESIRP